MQTNPDSNPPKTSPEDSIDAEELLVGMVGPTISEMTAEQLRERVAYIRTLRTSSQTLRAEMAKGSKTKTSKKDEVSNETSSAFNEF